MRPAVPISPFFAPHRGHAPESGHHYFSHGCSIASPMTDSSESRAAVEWLTEEGFIRSNDCLMVVADSTGDYVGEASRRARIIVLMDDDRARLEAGHASSEGGCKVELFEKDWSTYVPARGRYDSVVVCPSRFSSDTDVLMRIETVSKRSCAAVFEDESEAESLERVLAEGFRPFISYQVRGLRIVAWELPPEESLQGSS